MSNFSVQIRHVEGYRFEVDFGGTIPRVVTDLPSPLGTDAGPNPEHLLAAATANCLSATLLFTLNKMKIPFEGLTSVVEGTVERNERGRPRVVALQVRLELKSDASDEDVARADKVFRDYCTVTESLQHGIRVASTVVRIPSTAESRR